MEKARDTADAVARGAAIRNPCADPDKKTGGNQHHKAFAGVGGEGLIERIDQDGQEKDPGQKGDAFAAVLASGAVDEASENATGTHDPAIREEVKRPAAADHKARQ